jgi:hypothetical protein
MPRLLDLEKKSVVASWRMFLVDHRRAAASPRCTFFISTAWQKATRIVCFCVSVRELCVYKQSFTFASLLAQDCSAAEHFFCPRPNLGLTADHRHRGRVPCGFFCCLCGYNDDTTNVLLIRVRLRGHSASNRRARTTCRGRNRRVALIFKRNDTLTYIASTLGVRQLARSDFPSLFCFFFPARFSVQK